MRRVSIPFLMVICYFLLFPVQVNGEEQIASDLLKITYYPEKNVAKPEDEQVAIYVVKRLAERLQIQVSMDINNKAYQELVYLAAVNMDRLSPQERDAMIRYVKYVDVYANKQKNQRIKALAGKMRSGKISLAERSELIDLMPIPKSTSLQRATNQNEPVGTAQIEKNGYNRNAAKEYAYYWWDKRNNEEYGYYSRVSGGCYDCWYDCTNFASQVIKTGGINQIWKGASVWYYSDEKPSLSWGLSNAFFQHLKTRAELAKDLNQLKIGDVINVDFDGDGDIEHSAIITKKDRFGTYATYHTQDTKDRIILDWIMAFDSYGWKMETVKNE